MVTCHSDLLDLLETDARVFPENIAEHLEVFRFGFFLRRIQETLIADYVRCSEIRCPVHFCLGQELTYGILHKSVRPDDLLFSHHRSHGSYFAKNGSLDEFFRELLGKVGSACNGYAGSQDISSPANNMHAGAIVSGSIGLALGGAFTLDYHGISDKISIAVFGEGATNQGLFYECLNYASLRRLPVLLVCENNQFATYSTIDRHTAGADLKSKVDAFNISYGCTSTFLPGDAISLITRAISNVRNSRQPAFVEVLTYRYNPHVGPQDDTGSGYRTAADIESWRRFDALNKFMVAYAGAPWMHQFRQTVERDAHDIEASYQAARSAPAAVAILDSTMSNAFSAAAAGIRRLDLNDSRRQQALTVPGPY